MAGFPEVRGRDLVESLVRQVEPFRPTWRLGSAARTIQESSDHFALVCGNNVVVNGRAVIVTGGVGTFTPRPLTGTEHFAGSGISYFVRDPSALAGQRVVIVGGGDSAFDWADMLHDVAADVVMVHRRDRFRAHQDTVDRVLGRGVQVLTNSQVHALEGAESLTAVLVADATTSVLTRVECDHVVAALGFVANLGAIGNWGLELVDRKIQVDQQMRTSRPGIFAAGDICSYSGRVPLIAVGFGEAATAVNHAAVHLDPRMTIFPGHSTDGTGAQPLSAVPQLV